MLKVILGTYKKNRITSTRAFPMSFIIGRGIGGFFTVVFSYFMYIYFFDRNVDMTFLKYSKNIDYMSFVVFGAAVNVLGTAIIMNISRAFITELREGTLETLLMSPASRTGYHIGCLLEQLVRSMCEFAFILVVGSFFGAKLNQVFSFDTLIVLLLVITSFFTFSFTVSSLMIYARDTYILQNTIFHIMYLMGGVVFPIEYLPKWLQALSYLLPLTPVLKLYREIIILGNELTNSIELVTLILFNSIWYFAIGSFALSTQERKIVENVMD